VALGLLHPAFTIRQLPQKIIKKALIVTVAVWIALTTAPTDQKVQYSDRNLNSYLTIYT
jgi:hypothetical protein